MAFVSGSHLSTSIVAVHRANGVLKLVPASFDLKLWGSEGAARRYLVNHPSRTAVEFAARHRAMLRGLVVGPDGVVWVSHGGGHPVEPVADDVKLLIRLTGVTPRLLFKYLKGLPVFYGDT